MWIENVSVEVWWWQNFRFRIRKHLCHCLPHTMHRLKEKSCKSSWIGIWINPEPYLLPVNEQQGAQLKGNGGQKINRMEQKHNDAEKRGYRKMVVGCLPTPLILIRELCHNHLMCGIVIIIRINTLITFQWHITQSATNIGIYSLARGASHYS